MYISAIEIEGFKSFADKTVIPLNKKLNIIIGPNGSGKSNIIDAISFVLGESSRNLRADKGVNLIYKGSKNVGKAFVSLIVDLENNYPEELKDYFDEEVLKEGKIILSRQIKKSGESNYLINNQRVNKAFFSQILSILKLNTPYNIIFQGDITNIVKSSPIEKRKIIEELINIDYFEKKKEKVQKELESAQLKLNELIVLLNEKRKLLEELKEEKEKAEKFLELEKKKNSLLKAKYMNELEGIDKKINEINNILISIETKMAQLSLKKKNLKDEIKNLENELLKINDEIRKKGGPNLKELEEKGINNLKEIEKLKAEIKNLEEKINEINYEIEKEEEEKRKLINEIIKLEKIKKEIDNQLLKKEKELEQYNLDFNYEEIEKLEKEIEAIKEKIINLKNKKLFLEEKIKNLSINNEFNFENIEKELNNLREKDAQLASEQNLINRMIKEKEEELFNLKKKYEEQLNEIMQDKAIKRILELKEEIEGLYGPLFMLGRTKEKYKKALEMAAGPRMRAIVVENEDVAKKIIEILKQEKLGILSFIPLNRIKPKYINYEADYGVIGLAVDLIEFDPKFEKAFRYVFGDTLVIEDFETAKRIGIGKYRMVTLDGELFEVSGVITGGYQKKRHSFIDNTIKEKIKNIELEIESLKNRLKEIKEEREKLAERLFELRLKKKELEKNKELITNFEKIKSEIQELNSLIQEKENELKEKQKLLNDLKEKFNKALNLIKEKDKLMNEISELKAKLAQIKENMVNNKNLIEEKEKRLKGLNEKDK
ncbi:MAG: AAA family ATPase, partial [Nanoarchaeota archaeon]